MQENPSEELIILVHFVQKAYAPTVFSIVLYPGAENGSHHFLNFLRLSKQCLSRKYWEYIQAEFAPINSYWAHPECLLFSGLVSPLSTAEEKQRSCDLILQFRAVQRKSKSKRVRKFTKPQAHQLNFEARTLVDLPIWNEIAKSQKNPPPVLQHLSDEELQHLASQNTVFKTLAREKIPNLKCHSQDNERNIQLVTKVMEKTEGHDQQKGNIITTQNSREDFPCGSTKAEVTRRLQ